MNAPTGLFFVGGCTQIRKVMAMADEYFVNTGTLEDVDAFVELWLFPSEVSREQEL